MRDLPLKLTLDHRNVATKRLRVTLPAGNDRRRDKSQICTCDNQNLSQEQMNQFLSPCFILAAYCRTLFYTILQDSINSSLIFQ